MCLRPLRLIWRPGFNCAWMCGLRPPSQFNEMIISVLVVKAWSPYSCNGRKHRCKHVSDSVPNSSDTREHFDYNIASLTGIVINCSVSSSCNDRSNHWRHFSSLVSSCIANLNLRDMAKQLLTPLRLIAHMNFSLKNYSCELVNLIGTVWKVELIPTSTTAVCESWNVSDKHTWYNAADLKQLSMDQTLSEDNRKIKTQFFHVVMYVFDNSNLSQEIFAIDT